MDTFNPALPATQAAAPADFPQPLSNGAPLNYVVATEAASSLDSFADEDGKRQGFLVKLYKMIDEADSDVVAWENGALSCIL
jgi:hypothetical protein